MTLEEQYLSFMGTAREGVSAVTDAGTREALQATLEAMSRLHMLLMQHQSENTQAFFDVKDQIDSVLYNT